MQLATVEFARHVAGLKEAHTTEVNPETPHPVIHIMPDQEAIVTKKKYGGTMRLGSYACALAPKTVSRKAYGKREITERHRHRYEFNSEYRERLERAGLTVAGASPDGSLVEIVEVADHPFFVGVQFHPEFKSRPLRPHPLFLAFIKAAMG
jgi:CTP synthase